MFEEKANPQAAETLGDFFIGRMNFERLKDEHLTPNIEYLKC